VPICGTGLIRSVAPTPVARAASAIEIEERRSDSHHRPCRWHGASGCACGGAVDAMISVHSNLHIVVSTAPIDFRRAMDSMAMLVT